MKRQREWEWGRENEEGWREIKRENLIRIEIVQLRKVFIWKWYVIENINIHLIYHLIIDRKRENTFTRTRVKCSKLDLTTSEGERDGGIKRWIEEEKEEGREGGRKKSIFHEVLIKRGMERVR